MGLTALLLLRVELRRLTVVCWFLVAADYCWLHQRMTCCWLIRRVRPWRSIAGVLLVVRRVRPWRSIAGMLLVVFWRTTVAQSMVMTSYRNVTESLGWGLGGMTGEWGIVFTLVDAFAWAVCIVNCCLVIEVSLFFDDPVLQPVIGTTSAVGRCFLASESLRDCRRAWWRKAEMSEAVFEVVG